MKKETIHELMRLADLLDSRGLVREANQLDSLIVRASILSNIKEWFSKRDIVSQIMTGAIKSVNVAATINFLLKAAFLIHALVSITGVDGGYGTTPDKMTQLADVLGILSKTGVQLSLFIPAAIAYITKLMLNADKEYKDKLMKAKDQLEDAKQKIDGAKNAK